ncbi:hypothetical protein OEZ85_007121 [Tetradesmus obliquus]|uniref:Uncharacterized protein n=1 Tax=Tetradesmus obliquus TaxID=3088 RepID=A0ABY8TYU7_TETOB|nr:hypothetical protein OEZ85_007121 [Tetradesmus obliquus]
MFQQHKLLMDSGFSYDQASLILEITERRAAPQPADAGIRSENTSRLGFDPRFGPGYTAGFEQGYEQGLMGPEGGQAGNDDDLAPYEPSGWAVAGTLLVVYAGVLLTFFALLASAGDVGAAVDPADVMLWW